MLHAGTADGSDAPETTATDLLGGQVAFGTPDEATTSFDVYQSELEDTSQRANILLQATNSIRSPDTFVVALLNGSSLTAQTRNSAGDATGSAFTPGIQLATVSFTTQGGNPASAPATFQHRARHLTSVGANGATGANGGTVIERRWTGSVSVGAIDVSVATEPRGRGGNGGAISPRWTRSIVALDTVARVVTVNGNLTARRHGPRPTPPIPPRPAAARADRDPRRRRGIRAASRSDR